MSAQPYGFTKDWYPATDAYALTRFAQEAASVEGGIVELGSYEGRSALILRRALPTRPILCVDAWPDGYVYERFKRNVHGHSINSVRVPWEQFIAERLWHTPIAVVHIDMDHTYEQVSAQIRWAASVLAPGGVLVGHDYQPGEYGWPEVVRAVDELIPQRAVSAHVWAARCAGCADD